MEGFVFRFAAVYADLKSAINQQSAQDDLQWWRSNHGPDMPMNWPQFEVFEPYRSGLLN